MTKQTSEIFKELASQGEKALDLIREVSYSPDQKKSLRQWGVIEASEMVGRSAQYIRQAEKSKKLPSPNFNSNSSRRSYSLAAVNKMREFFGTRPIKGKNSDPAVIAFANFKGGAAKTTSAVNCAQYFARKGYRVLFIDCDSQASGTQVFGYVPDQDIKENETLLPFLIGEINDLNPVIRRTYWDGLDLIPSNLALYNAEFILPAKIAEAAAKQERYEFYDLLSSGLATIRNKYDIIVIDCPPSMGMISINAVFSANAIIIPTPPAMLDFTSTVQFFNMLHETLQRLPGKHYRFIRILITKHDGRASSDAIVSILRELYGKYVMSSIMFNTEVIKRASANMQTLYEIDKYEGSKQALNRAIQIADLLHGELESLLKASWGTNE
jgi:chromosome partitioning protein